MIGMKNREERAQHFFDTSVPLMDDGDDNTLYDRVREGAAKVTAVPWHSSASSCPRPQLLCSTVQCSMLLAPRPPSGLCSRRKNSYAVSSFPEPAEKPCGLLSRSVRKAVSPRFLGKNPRKHRVIPEPLHGYRLGFFLCPLLW